MEQMLEVKPGSVTPLAILNNKDKNILMIFDSELQNQTIGMHPMENTATVFLKFEDLYTLLLPHGNEIRIMIYKVFINNNCRFSFREINS